jgi:hypothetical protein
MLSLLFQSQGGMQPLDAIDAVLRCMNQGLQTVMQRMGGGSVMGPCCPALSATRCLGRIRRRSALACCGLVALTLSAAFAAQDPPRVESIKPLVRCTDLNLTVSLKDTPLRDALDEIGRACKVEIIGNLVSRPVTVQFQDLPLSEALSRLLRDQNFALIYSATRRIVGVRLVERSTETSAPPDVTPSADLSVPAASVQAETADTATEQAATVDTATATVHPDTEQAATVDTTTATVQTDTDQAVTVDAATETPPEPQPAPMAVERTVPVSTALAYALGTDTITSQDLMVAALNQQDHRVREAAQEALVDTLNSDPEIEAVYNAFLEWTDAANTAQLLRRMSDDRSPEELMMRLASGAQSPELRAKALAVIEQLGQTPR